MARRTRSVVLVAIKGLGLGGAEKLIAEGARYWDRDRFDYRVVYFLPWKDQLVAQLEEQGVRVTSLGTRWGMTPDAVYRLHRLARKSAAAVVHVHSPTVAVAMRATRRVPLVYTEHNVADSYRQPTRLLNRLTYGRNAAVTAVSEEVAASLAGFPGPAPRVIVNGVAASVTTEAALLARRELGLAADDRLVVHVGNIRPGKGHDTLIEAATRLAADITIVSLGTERHRGDLDRLRTEAARAGVATQLKFLGQRADALAFISAADVYVSPADHEGLPVSILEALALERPVVATSVGGVPSVIRPEETGMLVAPNQPVALAEAITHVLAHPVAAADYARRGRALVEERFSLERMVGAFEDIYTELLDG